MCFVHAFAYARLVESRLTKAAKYIQLFRERLSYKRRKVYVTMSKVIMANAGFTLA